MKIPNCYITKVHPQCEEGECFGSIYTALDPSDLVSVIQHLILKGRPTPLVPLVLECVADHLSESWLPMDCGATGATSFHQMSGSHPCGVSWPITGSAGYAERVTARGARVRGREWMPSEPGTQWVGPAEKKNLELLAQGFGWTPPCVQRFGP